MITQVYGRSLRNTQWLVSAWDIQAVPLWTLTSYSSRSRAFIACYTQLRIPQDSPCFMNAFQLLFSLRNVEARQLISLTMFWTSKSKVINRRLISFVEAQRMLTIFLKSWTPLQKTQAERRDHTTTCCKCKVNEQDNWTCTIERW